MQPAPSQVSETVQAMIGSTWPTTDAEALAWLGKFGIKTDSAPEGTVKEVPRQRATRAWHLASTRSWGSARAGWTTFRDEFVGVHWFLWTGASSDEVMGAAHDLVDNLTRTHGAPTESMESTEHGGTWFWRLPEHTIDLYAYHGQPRADGYPSGGPCLQLHVDLRSRAELQEEDARAHPAERPSIEDQSQ